MDGIPLSVISHEDSEQLAQVENMMGHFQCYTMLNVGLPVIRGSIITSIYPYLLWQRIDIFQISNEKKDINSISVRLSGSLVGPTLSYHTPQ